MGQGDVRTLINGSKGHKRLRYTVDERNKGKCYLICKCCGQIQVENSQLITLKNKATQFFLRVILYVFVYNLFVAMPGKKLN